MRTLMIGVERRNDMRVGRFGGVLVLMPVRMHAPTLQACKETK